jgi:hypothetical protein
MVTIDLPTLRIVREHFERGLTNAQCAATDREPPIDLAAGDRVAAKLLAAENTHSLGICQIEDLAPGDEVEAFWACWQVGSDIVLLAPSPEELAFADVATAAWPEE